MACVAESVKPFVEKPAKNDIDHDEGRVWLASDHAEKALNASGRVVDNPELTDYLQGIMDKLYPEFRGAIRVNVLRSPDLNAFAFGNGGVYFHTGMLARLENEAQVATVLAHEGAHFTRRHSLRSRRQSDAMVGIYWASIFVGLPPIVGQALGASSIAGYSRDMEREADAEGYKRLVAAGYDGSEAAKTFEILRKEVEILKIKSSLFFSSHPELVERIESFRALSEERSGGEVKTKDYHKHMAGLGEQTVQDYLAVHQPKSVILMLESKASAVRGLPHKHYYLGEAYRQRADEGDDELAKTAYLKALAEDSEFVEPLRALGLWHMKHKQKSRAIKYFQQYLQRAPNASDRSYINHYVQQLQEG